MTKKEYNAIVRECTGGKCFDCGAKTACNMLEEAGKPTPHLKYYSELTPSCKLIVANAGDKTAQ